jgi:hypothetical protein
MLSRQGATWETHSDNRAFMAGEVLAPNWTLGLGFEKGLGLNYH